MLDERYIRLERPVIIVYRADILPEPKVTVERWREYCLRNKLGDPYLIAAQTFGLEDPRTVGFDAAVQFPPHNEWHAADLMIQNSIEIANPEYSSYIFSYPKMVDRQEKQTKPSPYPLYKTVFPSWDSEPRKPGRGTIYAYSKPSLYRRWLQAACSWTLKNHTEGERLLFINAWNEWAEGAHLEPDRRFGYANLPNATMDVIRNLEGASDGIPYNTFTCVALKKVTQVLREKEGPRELIGCLKSCRDEPSRNELSTKTLKTLEYDTSPVHFIGSKFNQEGLERALENLREKPFVLAISQTII